MFDKANKVHDGFYIDIFNEEELEKIHQGTLHILEKTGVIVDDEEARSYFEKGGAIVNHQSHLVNINTTMIEAAMESAPNQIHLAGRGNKGFHLGDGKVRFCSFGESPRIMDHETKTMRDVTLKDVESYAHIVDALPAHDMCWDAWVPSSLPPDTYNLYTLAAYLNNTEKPVCSAAPNGVIADAIVKILSAVAGSPEALRERPIALAGTCPKSPLHLDAGICEATIVLARGGVPIMHTSALTAGGTGPVTLAGTMMIHNAEMLACLVLSQLVSIGTPYVYGACTTVLDLRKGTATFGCPEIGMFSAGFVKLCKKYKLPHVVAGFWTDSKSMDMQCGHEKTLNGLIPAMAGADMIFGTACLATGMLGSLGQLVADDEMIIDIRRVLAGILIDDNEMALNLIHKVGPQGNYLAEEHTIMNMRNSQVLPSLMDRSMTHEWVNNGSKTLADKANEKACNILKEHTPKTLTKEIKKELESIIHETNQKLGI